jgi:hypothetical protein
MLLVKNGGLRMEKELCVCVCVCVCGPSVCC